MRILQLLLLLVFLAAALLFAWQNQETVSVVFWNWKLSAPQAIVILGSYVLGMLSGWSVVGFLRRSYERLNERPS